MQAVRNGRIIAVTVMLGALALLVSIGGAQAQAGGSVLINARAGGAEAEATVTIATAEAEPREVAKGRSGRPISVPAGTYDVNIVCTELVDQPTQTLQGVRVGGGETVEREASFPAGTVTLHIRMGGRMLKSQSITLVKAGAELPGSAKNSQAFKVSPGTYEAMIKIGKKSAHTITGIQAYDGATRQITADL